MGQTPSQAAVEECFEVWLNERNAAAGRHLFPHVCSSLQTIRDTFPNACVGAITNGRGNPLDIEPLQPYFEFCVSGEDDGVFPARKPHPGIYEAALYPHHDKDTHAWIHVGDCLANDVGASVACGAAAVWLSEDDIDEQESSTTMDQPSWSTASAQDVQERCRLARQSQKDVSVRIANLAELPAAIEQVLQGAPVMRQ